MASYCAKCLVPIAIVLNAKGLVKLTPEEQQEGLQVFISDVYKTSNAKTTILGLKLV